MRKESLALLLGYFKNQRSEIDSLLTEIENIEPQNSETIVYLGYFLHNLYCAFEDLFKEVAKTFENQVEDPSRYHRELLKRMTIEVPLIRPNLLSKEGYKVLDELRRFRHTFRHAYTYELDTHRVRDLKLRLLSYVDSIIYDMDRFEDYLKEKLAEESG